MVDALKINHRFSQLKNNKRKSGQKRNKSSMIRMLEILQTWTQISVGPVDEGDLDIYTSAEKKRYFQRRKEDVSWQIADASSKGIGIQLTF